MIFVVNFNDTPWIRTAADLASVRCRHLLIGTDDCEGDLASYLLSFRDGFVILILVDGRLEDVDVVISNVGEDLVICI